MHVGAVEIVGNAGTGGVAGGNGGLFGNYTKGGTRGPAKIWMRARAPIPPQFTAMGTLILPTLKLNTGSPRPIR
ncbi:hypothetical protein [Mycobacteroides abscessus]|uniref:hypothetical protein n=1 Tax=Mycobacteroides abscessus TaxID=36809 RepID=UPI001F23574D|nr:hypothetical protein [Mycobacteroides abscessus]